MKKCEPTIFLIGKTVLDREAIEEWMHYLEAGDFEIPYVDEDSSAMSEGALLTMLAGKRCYMSFDKKLNPNLGRVRTDLIAFIDNILMVGHGSVLEHTSFNFAIEGVSRILTHELVRHRVGVAISQESGRFCRPGKDGFPFWMPGIFRPNADDDEKTREKRSQSRKVIEGAVRWAECSYRSLEEIWEEELAKKGRKAFKLKKKLTSAFRRIAPHGYGTGLVWTANIRTLRFVLEKRLPPDVEEEFIILANLLLRKMQEIEPECFGDFTYDDEKAYWFPAHSKV